MTVRDTQAHLQEIYGVQVSPELISKVTDAILPELRAWQQRPLDAVYPILYLDAIVVKVRSDHVVVNRPVYIAMAIDVDGQKHVLGLWLGKGDEGAKFWLGVITELKNRGVTDVLVVCCDGLTGFGDAIEAVWPQATVQTCVVHLIRNSMRYCSWKDRKAVTKALKPVYQAANVDAAADALDHFEAEWGDMYPAIVDLWRRNWERFTPFLAFDAAGTERCAAPSSPVSDATTCHWRKTASCCNSLNRKRSPDHSVWVPIADQPDSDWNPTARLEDWLEAAARLRPTATEAVWLHVTRGDTVTRDAPITAAAINNVVQRRVSAAGLENASGYSAHSLRAGFVTEAKNRGIEVTDTHPNVHIGGHGPRSVQPRAFRPHP